MKRFLKATSYVLIAILFSVALSGCKKTTTTDPKATTVTVWGFEDEDAWKSVEREFEKQNKGFTLVYVKQTFDSTYENRSLNAILSGQGPDVWEMPNDWVYRHKDKLVSVPAQPGKNDLNVGINNYIQSVKDSIVINNQVYALTPYAEPLMIYYNPKVINNAINTISNSSIGNQAINQEVNLLQSVPSTWTDFTKAANLLTQKDSHGKITIAGVAMGTEKITNANDLLYLLMLQNKTDIVSSNLQQANFNLPSTTSTDSSDVPGLRALNFYTSFADPTSPNYSWDDSLGANDVDAFINSKVAMVFGYSSLGNYLSQTYPNFNYKKASMPQLTTDISQTVDYAHFNVYSVVANSTAPYTGKEAAAWNLIDELSNKNGDLASSFDSALNVYSSAKSSSVPAFQDRNTNNPEKFTLYTARSIEKGRYPTEFDNTINQAITEANHKTLGPQAALDSAATTITNLLRKTNW